MILSKSKQSLYQMGPKLSVLEGPTVGVQHLLNICTAQKELSEIRFGFSGC